MGLSFNLDVSARPFYESILVTEFVSKHLKMRDMSRPLSEQERIKVNKALRGLEVVLNHQNHVKTYKVTGVSAQPLNQIMFTLDDKNTEISVAQYFCERYNIGLTRTTFPALQAGSDSKPIYLPIELCRIVEGQRYSKKLNRRQVNALLKATCERPPQLEANIKWMVKQNNYSKDFGIQVKEELTFVDARVLPPPVLNYHETGAEAMVCPTAGQWNMNNKKMINGGRVDYWTCVNFSLKIDQNSSIKFCEELRKMCVSKGMVFNQDAVIPIQSVRPDQIERTTLIDIDNQCMAALARRKINAELQILIVILPDVTGSYGLIKRVCETELGIVTQCCQPKQASRRAKQCLENLALKINVKVGGRNNVLSDAIHKRIPLVFEQPTIILGAYVTHPPPGEDYRPSIAAVVGSMDWPEVTKYTGAVSAQAHREEIIQYLYKTYEDTGGRLRYSGMIRKLLCRFRSKHTDWPRRIIFYRNGVSEGQYNRVLVSEMDAVRKACQSLADGYRPTITLVVVQKRHHTRLFPAGPAASDKNGNIRPGTVVDTKICHHREFDFYLNSHVSIKGTSRPTHYHVLHDENCFSANELQMLTNSLCYTYARCTRSVSIVSPVYYARLLARRARWYYMEERRARCYYMDDCEKSDDSPSGRMTGLKRKILPLPDIVPPVKDVMFYC